MAGNESEARIPRNVTPNHPNFKRILLACLVKAAYTFENDRQKAIKPQNSRASAWHFPFHYKLHSLLYSPVDGSIVGAIFRYSKSLALKSFIFHRPKNCPAAVVALRGTILKVANISDIWDDIKVILQQTHNVSRLNQALQATREVVKCYGAPNVLIAGHSLGAAVGLTIARLLAMEGVFVETHLFNPPFFTLIPVRDEKLGILINRIRAIAGGCLEKNSEEFNDSFVALQRCCPHLYVNLNDPVSCNYVHYFRARDSSNMYKSIVKSILSLLGRKPEPHHLVPCADLYINDVGREKIRVAHGLNQWLLEETQVQIERHRLDVPDFAVRFKKFA